MSARAPLVLLGLALGAMNATSDSPPTGRILPFEAAEKTLPNGLRVIVVPTGFPNIVSLQIPVQTGSRNEVEPGKSGFAHFFEHMMFRGTKKYPPDAYQAILTKAGARQNAYTSDDYTNYHTTFAKEDLATILEMEADRFQNLAYSEEAFKTEARAVLGEYNKNASNPIQKLIEVEREHAFDVHTYKHTTMGFLKDIEDMPNQFEYSKVFFDRWYRPEHTTVMVAGDVKADEVFPLVERYWGSWKRGSFEAKIPAEPAPKGPVVTEVPWAAPTLPWVSVSFHGPAFSETGKDWAALDILGDLTFGPTSALYKRLVEDEQKVDDLGVYFPPNVDPYLMMIYARVKKGDDAAYVRDAILKAVAAARLEAPPAARVADAKGNARYGLLRSLDNTETIAATLARFVRYRRSFDTLNAFYRTYDTVAPADLLAAARKYLADSSLVQTTLAKDPLPGAIKTLPALASLGTEAKAGLRPLVVKSVLPQLDVKLLFAVGSAHDPKGKEGLAALSAAMIAEAGSREKRTDEIKKALFPMAASFSDQVDREMTTFTARVHRDNWDAFAAVALPQLTEPGFREEDFERLKDQQRNALKQDLRTDNDEELGKETLQSLVFAGTPYAHPTLGTVAGIEAITLADVQEFVKKAYTRANLKVGISGDAPAGLEAALGRELGKLPEGPPLPAPAEITGKASAGLSVRIVEKETRSTAISFGHPIAVTRSHPDYAALSVARSWLGEHRASSGRLFQRLREARGLNYGDYAYIEAFPRGMFQFFPDPNIARRAQIFEVWIRPVVPDNAVMALRLALSEISNLVARGLTAEDFETTRAYLMKNVFLQTATQDQQLGYALDSQWYGIPEYTSFMREKLQKLTLADVNAAIKKHLKARDFQVVMVTKDGKGLKDALLAKPSPIHYDASKPPEILNEDEAVAAVDLGLRPEAITITPVEEIFSR
jgi:zinc protease